MDSGLAISIVALIVAGASATYARRAASEARTANRIASHTHKLEILQAARDFQGALRVHGEALDAAVVYSLLAASSRASLYFNARLADSLASYAAAGHDMLIARDSARAFETASLDAGAKWQDAFDEVDRCRALEGSLLAELEAQTKIVD